jgi:energy-coupling factor transporter transmembrane protein EcfT
LGVKFYATKIKKRDLEPLGKTLSMFSWQFHTIFLFITSCTLIYIASNPEFAIAAYPIIYINVLGAIYFFILGIGNKEFLKMPGAILMGSIALLAWLGI